MSRYVAAIAALFLVAGCGGPNPFASDSQTDQPDDPIEEPGDGGIGGDRVIPPGTPSPQPDESIYRTEPTAADGGARGDGFAQSITYNAADDTFSVDNLGFDGDNTYSRGTAIASLGPYAVYEADAQFIDPNSGVPVNQFTHRAIYGVSTSTNTQFAIVRTGAYVDYGFGGFVYQREGGVTLPTTGQASYSGEMAGLRDFDGAAGMEFTRANIDIAIDFDDFNDVTGTRGDAVGGLIYNRRIYDINGVDITDAVIDRINQEEDASLTQIPVATFTVGPGVMDDNGEILGEVTSRFVDNDGNAQLFEEGKYYAVVSGDNADEIVGVVVTTSNVGLPSGVTVRETGGFIVYRN